MEFSFKCDLWSNKGIEQTKDKKSQIKVLSFFEVLPETQVESSGWQMKQKHHCIFNMPLISFCVVLINLCMFPVCVCVCVCLCPLNFQWYINHLSQYHICNKLALILSSPPEKNKLIKFQHQKCSMCHFFHIGMFVTCLVTWTHEIHEWCKLWVHVIHTFTVHHS